ncbi:MAG TPA: valine--tRNA ligase [Steroidobacteraceae bacterium]|nr:valine--tRNA ligase [Steroidobacteraceae bacterium]HRX88714.1 valine--tRNA ligase [Steroidobacteraceae bacterium]
MEKVYLPQALEQRIYANWEAAGWFAPQGNGPGYCIMLPPPNVTGTLHMGHAFQHTLMDVLTRWHRMRGDRTLWQSGTDHAGIATQMVVERQLNAAGQHRLDLGRDAFVERVWQWKEQSGGTITRQMRRLGDSVDWSRDKFTMDPELSRAVTEVFVRLHEKGLIYRGKRLVNWDPVLLTAVSDLEVLSEEEQGSLWHLRYPLIDGSGHVIVATTRPETMLGDTAVAVHPEDERYRGLIGKRIALPLAGRDIPIIADDYVDPSFGSGCVKITPAHDFNDYDVGQRHQLAQINIFTPDARINDNGPVAYRGLDRATARKQIVADLEAAGLIDKVDAHKLMVPRGDRTGAVIEPYLTDQWYVKIAPLAAPAIRAVEDGSIRFVPENWNRTYFEWMRNIKDWCISRQLWWGHRIPAWYGPDGAIYVGRSETEVRRQHQLGAEVALRQDEDVLDTWFSSALWPFSTLGWPEATPELEQFYPTNVLVTGFDIIFFWVARMVMMGIEFTGDVPFRDIYITGLIRDERGDKMSKSKGNVIDPLDIIDGIDLDTLVAKRTTGLMQPHLAKSIEKATRMQFPAGIEPYGTDALRFTFAALAGPSRDIRFDLGRVGGYRNFCNKLWNAARFVLLVLEGQDGAIPADDLTGPHELSVADRWIRSRFGHMLRTLDTALTDYRFDFAATALYEFTWYEFCDWYLELTKPVLQSDSVPDALKRGARRTLLEMLEALLRALHPVMPFITEEIWQRVAPLTRGVGLTTGTKPTIMLADFPAAAAYVTDPEAESATAWIQGLVLAIRQIRGEMDIAPSKRIPVLLQNAGVNDREYVDAYRTYLERLAGLERIEFLAADATAPEAATALVGTLTVLVPMAGLIDPAAEAERLAKRIAKQDADLGKLRGKLGNVSFVANAPPEVVAGDRARVAALESQRERLQQQLERVRRLANDPAGAGHG